MAKIIAWVACAASLMTLSASCAMAQSSNPEFSGSERMLANRRFFEQVNQPTGIVVPLYHYPAHVHQNPIYNRLIDLKLKFPKVPAIAILNPASGPGESSDANYVKAIDRLQGAGVVLLAYVSTEYAKRASEKVKADIAQWEKIYPKMNGLFFDEMSIKPEHAALYAEWTRLGHNRGYWPIFANPGTATPQIFFDEKSADVFVIYEGNACPSEKDLKGDYFGGYADYPPHTRSVLIHSRKDWIAPDFDLIRKYSRWVYVTDQIYRTPADNPWDGVSRHLEQMFHELSRP